MTVHTFKEAVILEFVQQMTKMGRIDPASTKTSLETILTYLERAMEKCSTVQTRDDNKDTWTTDALILT